MSTDKPTLAYILKGYPRISETFISNEMLRLEQMGFTIIVFPMRKPREDFSHDSVKQIKAEVFYLPTNLWKNLLQLLPPNISLLFSDTKRYGKALSVALKRFRRTHKIATFKHLLQAGFMVKKHLNGDHPVDHLHGHFAHSPTSVTYFASLLTGLPYSFTAHAKDIYTSNTQQLQEKIKHAAFVVTCTSYNKNYLRGIYSGSDTPIHCIYHGIDTSLFQAAGARERCTPPYSLLTVARMTEKKGLPTLYHALARLKSKGVDFHHTLIGDGDDRDATLELIQKLNLADRCTWLGTQTHAQVLSQFSKSDIFVLSCRIAKNGDRDGIPNVLVESLAMGVPVLSTEVSAIPELIKQNQTGALVPPEEDQALADGILEMLTNDELRRRVIDSGKQRVHNSFDNTAQTKKLGEIFIQFHAEQTHDR